MEPDVSDFQLHAIISRSEMNEHFPGWLKEKYSNPGTYKTYISDFRSVEKRFGDVYLRCLSGEIDQVIDEIKASWEAGHNKSAKHQVNAIRAYQRFLDDYLQQEHAPQSPAGPNPTEPERPTSAEGASEKATTSISRRGGLTYSNGYWHPSEFPREAFVQESIESHFASLGFHRQTNGHADWVCKHPDTGKRWHVECKGLTTAVGLDFRTGLGQLLQAMRFDDTNYALAVPQIDAFLRQIERVDPAITSLIRVQFLLVDTKGKVLAYKRQA